MDRDFCQMHGSYSDESNQLNYFYPEESDHDKKKVSKPTAELSDSQDRGIQNEFGTEKNLTGILKVLDNNKQKRQKRVIKVNSKSRTRYLNTRKGTSQETHDLSINVCTIVKSLFKEFLTFQNPNANEVELLHQFMEQKTNLTTLRKLLSSNNLNESPSVIMQQKYRERTAVSFGQFFYNKMGDTEILREVLKSKKMKFGNKLIFFKYLETIKKSGHQPENLKKWKNNNF